MVINVLRYFSFPLSTLQLDNYSIRRIYTSKAKKGAEDLRPFSYHKHTNHGRLGNVWPADPAAGSAGGQGGRGRRTALLCPPVPLEHGPQPAQRCEQRPAEPGAGRPEERAAAAARRRSRRPADQQPRRYAATSGGRRPQQFGPVL
jgi:hypothetical protein